MNENIPATSPRPAMSVLKKWKFGVVMFWVAMAFLAVYFCGFHPVSSAVIFSIIIGVFALIWKVTHKSSRKIKIIANAVWCGCVAFFFFNPLMFWLIMGGAHIAKMERYICKPEVYKPAGEAMALYCQSYPLLQAIFEEDYGVHFTGAWLPGDTGLKFYSRWGNIHQKGAFFAFSGGFHHVGYELSLQSSTFLTNMWELSIAREHNREHLVTFPMNAARQLSADELFTHIMAGHDARIKNKPHDEYEWQSAWKNKIETQIKFGRIAEARATCREMLDAMPAGWKKWPMLTVALITAEEESFENAERMMTQWVKGNETFERYLDLAHFYQLSNKPQKAAEAMRQATKHNANRPDVNADYRGYAAAIYAYESGEYETVIQLCNHVLPVIINGDYQKSNLRALRQLALEAQQNPAQAEPLKLEKTVYDPYKDFDIQRLLHGGSMKE